MSTELSRLDAKIERERLLATKTEDLWNELCEAIREAVEKVNAHFGASLAIEENDQNSLVRVTPPWKEPERRVGAGRPSLDVRFKREDRRVIAQWSHGREGFKTINFGIRAEAAAGTLYFEAEGRRYSPVELAETLVAEKLLKIELDN